MKRCSLIIHSVSGNIYIIGEYLRQKLVELGVDARLYRVEDSDLHILANRMDSVNQYYEDILELPVASEETLLKADMMRDARSGREAVRLLHQLHAFDLRRKPCSRLHALLGAEHGAYTHPVWSAY